VHECTLGEAVSWLAGDPDRRKGEFVLIVQGAADAKAVDDAGQHALAALLAELPLRQAVDLATRITGGKKNELYRLALAMRKERDS
jgi:16S rRNA (cytidine1402-2'-O)-methyltransferase